MFLQNIKNHISGYFTGVTLLRDSADPCTVPKIYLSDARFAQSVDRIDDWEDLGIGLILNVTSENPADEETQQMYGDLGIEYMWLPIRDNHDPLPHDYLNNIIKFVKDWPIYRSDIPTMFAMDPDFYETQNVNPKDSQGREDEDEYEIDDEDPPWLAASDYRCDRPNILIHCSAGINRSALVAAAILWYTTPNRKSLWRTPEDLIEYMRARQREDRQIFMLSNSSFVDYLNYYLR